MARIVVYAYCDRINVPSSARLTAWSPTHFSLMIAFTADYAGGEITPDTSEIAEARWFGPQDVQPEAPPGVSISNRLVNAHWPGPR